MTTEFLSLAQEQKLHVQFFFYTSEDNFHFQKISLLSISTFSVPPTGNTATWLQYDFVAPLWL